MTGVVTFDAARFKLRYPVFAAVDDDLLQMFFDETPSYLNNTASSHVCNLIERATLLNMLTAHIAQLNNAAGSGKPGMVGRIASATEGTVSASAAYSDHVTGTMAWYIQTPYGASYWAATAKYRTMKYVPPATRCY